MSTDLTAQDDKSEEFISGKQSPLGTDTRINSHSIKKPYRNYEYPGD